MVFSLTVAFFAGTTCEAVCAIKHLSSRSGRATNLAVYPGEPNANAASIELERTANSVRLRPLPIWTSSLYVPLHPNSYIVAASTSGILSTKWIARVDGMFDLVDHSMDKPFRFLC